MAAAENRLIELLPQVDRHRLLAICKPVQLVLADVLASHGKPTRHLYFPIDSFISIVASIAGEPVLEVGMVGREGMLGTELALGVATAPLHALVQGPGSAWQVEAKAFRTLLAKNLPLQRGLSRYIYVQMAQLATASACLRFHRIEPRLARWLLMSQDRAHANRFLVTHEFLAYMLGVRRVGITAAAGALQRRHLIEYHRGDLTVLDRPGLEAAACSCYAADRQVYESTLG